MPRFLALVVALLTGGFLHADTNAAANPAKPPAPIAVKLKATPAAFLVLHKTFVQRAQQGNLNIVFFGDSSTACWKTTGKDIWDKQIAPLGAADFGIYGDDAQKLLWCLQTGELDGYQAKAFVIMIGAMNLIRGEPADKVVATITACLHEIKRRQPQAHVILFPPPHVYVPILVSKEYADNSTAVESSLAKLDNGSSFRVIDMSKAMEARETEMLMQILAAGDPHKSHVEFEVWWAALQPPLADIFSKTH